MGNWLNMPYFGAEGTTRYALREGEKLTAEEFLEYAQYKQRSPDQLDAVTLKVDEEFKGAPPCLVQICKAGIASGERNDALFNLAVLAKMKYPDKWEEKLEEYNRTYINPPLKRSEVSGIIGSVSKKDGYFYKCSQAPIVNACDKHLCKSREFGIGNDSQKSKNIGVDISHMLRILSDPPRFVLTINGKRVNFDCLADIQTFSIFKIRCGEAVSIVPRKLPKASMWDDVVNDLMRRQDYERVPKDSGVSGEVLGLLEDFCNELSGENSDCMTLGRPWLNERKECYQFKSKSFKAYLRASGCRVVEKSNLLWSILRTAKCTESRATVNKKTFPVWEVPTAELTLRGAPDVHEVLLSSDEEF
jgi:hypothetical protein